MPASPSANTSHSPSPNTTTHLLYLHGFRSSPLSTKSRMVAAAVAAQHPAVTWWCPQLPPSPRAAMHMLMDGIAQWPKDRMAVVGSSLGGFYASHVAEVTGCRAVMLNPAVYPERDLQKYIGEQTSWHDPNARFEVLPEFTGELLALQHSGNSHPGTTLAIIAKGDEVLDWREMQARYADCHVTLLEGGDHAISDFTVHMPAVLEFLALA